MTASGSRFTLSSPAPADDGAAASALRDEAGTRRQCRAFTAQNRRQQTAKFRPHVINQDTAASANSGVAHNHKCRNASAAQQHPRIMINTPRFRIVKWHVRAASVITDTSGNTAIFDAGIMFSVTVHAAECRRLFPAHGAGRSMPTQGDIV